MKAYKDQVGSTALVVVLFLAVVVLAGVVVIRARNAQQAASPEITQESRVAGDVPGAPSINSSQDLDAAEKTLDSVDPRASSSDDTQLGQQVDSF